MVARGWGIPAVVGAAAVAVAGDGVTIGERRFAAGDVLTIDGGSGEVFADAVAGTATIVPEATTLLGWARDLGIEIAGAATAAEAAATGAGRGPGPRPSTRQCAPSPSRASPRPPGWPPCSALPRRRSRRSWKKRWPRAW